MSRVHGRKFRCPDMQCDFVFAECDWAMFEDHKRSAHHFDVGEPIPVTKKTGKDLKRVAKKIKLAKGLVPTVPVCSTDHLSLEVPSNQQSEEVSDEVAEDVVEEWEHQPEEGFIILCDENEDYPVIPGTPSKPMEWKLTKVDVPRTAPRLLSGLTDRQRQFDPRLG